MEQAYINVKWWCINKNKQKYDLSVKINLMIVSNQICKVHEHAFAELNVLDSADNT